MGRESEWVFPNEIEADLRARLAECERRLEYSDPERGTQSFLDHEKGMEDRLAECEYQLQRQSEIYEGAADTEIERHYQEVQAWKAENRRLLERVGRLEAFKEQAATAVDGCDWIGVRSQCPFGAALAELENEK